MGKSTEPPKCKNCGAAHRGPCFQRDELTATERRALADTVLASKRDVVPKSKKHRLPRKPVVTDEAQKPKRGRPRLENPKSPRAEYQRELMRKRYAAKKAKPE